MTNLEEKLKQLIKYNLYLILIYKKKTQKKSDQWHGRLNCERNHVQ